MRFFTPLLCIGLLAFNSLWAEGTRQLAPNAAIDVMGNITTDLAALHINNPSYNNFAAFDNPNPQSRLYINIQNPAKECIYLGFNWAHNNVTSPNPPRINFQYQIKDPNGNIVFGPVNVTPLNANILNWSQGFIGPFEIHGAGGYDATLVTSLNLASQGWSGKGDYYIEFRDEAGDDLLIDFWDITVVDCSGVAPVEKTGRVWSYNWSIFAVNDFGFPNRPFNGAFYVCAPDPDNVNASFVTKINFNGSGFRPAAFNIAFNSFGIQNTGNVAEDRKSVELTNATQAEYAIFLNDPVDICVTAEIGEIEIIGISRCTGESYCIKFTTTKAGQIDLLLDFDGADNVYTPGTADVMVSHTVAPEQVGIPTCIMWDGLDGLGHPLAENAGTQIPITIAYAQGIYHFPIYDAEYMTNGFMIEAVRPIASIPLLYYDDSNISVSSGSGEPAMQLSGCNTPCHRWTNYSEPNTPGFGNLHTINSWWFSQLIIRQEIFFLPSYYTCEIEGPSSFCQGGTSQLTIKPIVSPAGAAGGEILSTTWTGPGIIGANTGASITIGSGGVYLAKVLWLTNLGDTCHTICGYEVTVDPPLTSSIDTLIIQGETIVINGESYSEGGVYIQELMTDAGCDSILTIRVIVINTVVHYDFNDCEANMQNGSHMDYSEFIATYSQPLSCATTVADTLHRVHPEVNKHSCTPGVNDTPAMCVSSLDDCTYDAGNDISVIFEITITPDADTAVHLTGLQFFEKAPTTYNWINGTSGPNNYPTLYGIRILKNGTEIYRREDIPTSLAWNEEAYDFLDDVQFLVKDPTTFRFELLPYCLVGNGALVAAWDLDEISVMASCASRAGLNKKISGIVATEHGIRIPDVEIRLFDDESFTDMVETKTDDDGTYLFESIKPEEDYYIKGYKNKDHANGVSTLDLIHIQKHLLGIKFFDSPYQYIAADANRSNSISAIDLVELRKLILGIYAELPRNTSWRFGVAGQDLDISHPWAFSECLTIEYLSDHITNMDFTGVKIGDLNGDVDPDFFTSKWTPRGSKKLLFHVKDQPITKGVPVTINFTCSDFTDIAGFQLALDVKNALIAQVSGGAVSLSEGHYAITGGHQLVMSWHPMHNISIGQEEVLFSIVLIPEINGTIGDLIQINEGPLHAEIYTGESLDKMDLDLDIQRAITTTAVNILFGNDPNPFSSNTVIRFQLERPEYVDLRFYDLSGRLLGIRAGDFERGQHAIEISRSDLGVQDGIILCHLQTGGFAAVHKMVLLKE